MTFKNKYFIKKIYLSMICLLFLVLFSFLMFNSYYGFERNVDMHSDDTKDMINQRVTLLLHELNIFPQYIGNDLLFISEMSSLRRAVNDKDANLADLENDFIKFLKQSTAYYQLRYIDENGDEIVRAEFNGEDYQIVSKDELHNKAERYYFQEAIKLGEEEVYLSTFDLNLGEWEIENRGTDRYPDYVPVIRSVIPVFNDDGVLRGVVSFNLYVDYFLENVRESQREGEDMFLIDSEGNYLANPDRKKEFGSQLGTGYNFYKDYPEFSRSVLEDFSKRNFEYEDFFFSFKYIYPTAVGSLVQKGSEKIFGEDHEKRYYWILMSVSEKGGVEHVFENLKSDYISFLLFSGIIIFVIIILIFIVVFRVNGGRK